MILIFLFRTIFITINKQNSYLNSYLYFDRDKLIINTLCAPSYYIKDVGKVIISFKQYHNKRYGSIQIIDKHGRKSKRYVFDGGSYRKYNDTIRNSMRNLQEELQRHKIQYVIQEQFDRSKDI